MEIRLAREDAGEKQEGRIDLKVICGRVDVSHRKGAFKSIKDVHGTERRRKVKRCGF